MLKIENSGTATEQRWTLCGQLAGPWVAELRSNWEQTRSAAEDRKRLVDLTDVTFVDERGVQLLQQMRNEGAEFTASGVDTKDLLENLNAAGKLPLRRFLAHLENGCGSSHNRA
jgi:anti-anti-sigma regulatory factor